MTKVLQRHIATQYPRAVSGEGIFIRDAEGRDYIDASGGAAVSCLGHMHPDVIAAMHAQLDQLAYAHTSFFTTRVGRGARPTISSAHAPGGMAHVYFVSGGSEAMEAALKMARQYFVEKGEPQRRHFIARRQSYHGNTLGALAVGGNAWRREQFEPLLDRGAPRLALLRLPRPPPDESAEAYGERLADELEAEARASSGPTPSSPSSPRRWSARRRARCRRLPAISGASARSATDTASCSSSTR